MATIDDFANTKPDIKRLREHHPEMVDRLTGTFANKPNIYNQAGSMVVSWPLIQGKEKNPTYGMVPKGKFNFEISGFHEEVTVLEGRLTLTTGGVSEEYGQYDSFYIPIGSKVELNNKGGHAEYLCEYSKEPKE